MLRWIGLLLIAYLVVVVLAWAFQDRLLYLPSVPGQEIDQTPGDRGWTYEEVWLESSDGHQIHGWWLPVEEARGTLLFFHGNAGNISHRLDTLAVFRNLNLSVLIIDYQGYGKSEGSPSETATEADARAAWDYLTEDRGLAPGEIVVAGRSLGSAVAAELARAHAPAGVLLESPFASLPELAQQVYPFLPGRWLTRYDYATRTHVAEIQAPVMVIHSRDDEIIPFSQGEAVYDAVGGSARLLELSGGHNTAFLQNRDRYMEGMEAFLTEELGW